MRDWPLCRAVPCHAFLMPPDSPACRWYEPLFFIFTIALPVLVPFQCWNETLWNSFWVNFNTRFSATLNVAFLINSLAHTHGFRPYDK